MHAPHVYAHTRTCQPAPVSGSRPGLNISTMFTVAGTPCLCFCAFACVRACTYHWRSHHMTRIPCQSGFPTLAAFGPTPLPFRAPIPILMTDGCTPLTPLSPYLCAGSAFCCLFQPFTSPLQTSCLMPGNGPSLVACTSSRLWCVPTRPAQSPPVPSLPHSSR